MIFIYITCKDKKEAEKIGLTLVERKLAACCNLFPIESVYRWKGRIVKSKETALIAKTLKKNFKKIESMTKSLHSYSNPCVLEVPLGRVSKKYLKWVESEVK